MKLKFGQHLDEDINYFITSDLHFFHKNILKFSPKYRPWENVEEMNERLIEHWNNTVSDGDVVFHLGDFSFSNIKNTKTIIDKLNGEIVWILGNHDKTIRDQHRDINKFDLFECRYEDVKVVMCHYPMHVWNQSHRGSVMMYGHSHGSLEGLGRSIDVGFDSLGKITPLEEVINMCLDKEIHNPDHH